MKASYKLQVQRKRDEIKAEIWVMLENPMVSLEDIMILLHGYGFDEDEFEHMFI